MSVLWYPMQLSMVIPSESEARIPPAPVPEGYELRGYQPGDDESWLALINTGAFGTPWPRSKFDEYMRGRERREGSRLAVKDGRVLAATFASVEDGSDSIAVPDDAKGMGRVDFVISPSGRAEAWAWAGGLHRRREVPVRAGLLERHPMDRQLADSGDCNVSFDGLRAKYEPRRYA